MMSLRFILWVDEDGRRDLDMPRQHDDCQPKKKDAVHAADTCNKSIVGR
jgi:hypothetical protein